MAQMGLGVTDANGVDPGMPVMVINGGILKDKIFAGSDSTCVLLSNATAQCWGGNSHMKLGTALNLDPEKVPTTVQRSTGASPVFVDIDHIGIGVDHSCLISAGSGAAPGTGTTGIGNAACWGWECEGRVGYNTNSNGNTPHPNPEVEDPAGNRFNNVKGKASFLTVGDNHACLYGTDFGVLTPAVYCWGDNTKGQLGATTIPLATGSCGLGLHASTSAIPAKSGTSNITGVVALTAGSSHTCALLQQGHTAKCWGDNSHGQLGNGKNDQTSGMMSNGSSPLMADVLDETGSGMLSGISEIAAGGNSTCALMSEGRVLCWGANDKGQLGDATTTDRLLPTLVQF